MSLRYPELFKPFNIGKVRIKNRICMWPMMITGLIGEDGQFSQQVIDYYEERAKAGVGLIFTYAIKSNYGYELENTEYCNPWKDPYAFKIHTRKMMERLHSYDCKVFMQIAYGSGRAVVPSALVGDAVHVGPSVTTNRWDPNLKGRALTVEEIHKLIDEMAKGALLCKESGADGVEIHSLYGGYLGDTFAMSFFNKRNDEYGGDLRGRLKIATDTVKAIKAVCGEDFPVTIRYGIKHYMKGYVQGALPGEDFTEVGRDLEEGIAAAKILEEAGYDGINVANGSYDSWYWCHPPMYHEDGCWLDTTAELKKNLHIPIISGGKVNLPETANDAIKEGKCDAIGMARAFWADAEWVKKANNGTPEEIRPCIGCHNGCMARIFVARPVTCAVNPDLGRESQMELKHADSEKNVMIIGGGVAGMECALNAAKRGHHVDLYDKNPYLGGVLYPASVPAFKDADRRLIHWYELQLKKAGVHVHLNTEVTKDLINIEDPDDIVVASGALPKIPPVPGKERAVTAVDVLLGKEKVGQKVAIIGGGQVGCELAVWLKEQGKEPVIIEALDELMTGGVEEIPAPNRLMLIDMVNFNKIEVKTGTKLVSISQDEVTVCSSAGEEKVKAESVIMAVGYYADRSFTEELRAERANIWSIGDQNLPTNILYAVAHGNAVGRAI